MCYFQKIGQGAPCPYKIPFYFFDPVREYIMVLQEYLNIKEQYNRSRDNNQTNKTIFYHNLIAGAIWEFQMGSLLPGGVHLKNSVISES